MKTRSGSVLLIVLASLALTAIAGAGLILLGARELLTSHVAADVVRVRSAAEASVRSAIAGWDRGTMPTTGPAGPIPLAAGSWNPGSLLAGRATAERIGPALWLVRGEAILGGGLPNGPLARAATAAMVVSIPAEMPWSAFPAALSSAGDLAFDPATAIDGTAATLAPPPWGSAECPPAAAAAGALLFGMSTRPGLALGVGAVAAGTPALLAGTPPIQSSAPGADTLGMDWLGPLRFDEALAAADRIETGVVAPAPPAAISPCNQKAPGNWGAPLDPAHPCNDFFPLIAAPAGLTVGPGAGQGILLVDGDLDLQPGAVFYGAIVVRGRLRSAGAVVSGAIRTLGTSGSLDLRINASDCALWRAFERAPAFRRAWRPPGRWWLPSAGL
jgi:hypothetical protein